jgi:type I restriction enzyme S subunit
LGEIAENYDGARVPISLSQRARKRKIYDYYGASGVIDKIDGYTHDGKYLLIGEDGANLLARSTPIAFIADGKFWVNNHAHVLGFLHDQLLEYIAIHINGIDLKPYVTGGFQPKLSQNNLNNILIALSVNMELFNIVDKVKRINSVCDQLESQITQSQKNSELLMQSVLKEAFEG